MKPDVSFICISDRPNCLRHLIACLRLQSNPRWELIVLDQSNRAECLEPIKEAEFLGERRLYWEPVKYHGDNGQTAKYEATKHARGKYVCFPCDDAYYAPPFVEYMAGHGNLHNWDLVYCNMVFDEAGYTTFDVAPKEGRIDIGGFIIRPELVIEDGWNRRDGRGDGALVERIAAKCSHGKVVTQSTIGLIQSVLYVKN